MAAVEPESKLEDLFVQWHKRFKPEEGWMTLKETVVRYEALGLDTPLPLFLDKHDVALWGVHMHGPGGRLPPWILDPDYEKEWSFDVDANWAREARFPATLQYAVQVQIDRASFESGLSAELAERVQASGPRKEAPGFESYLDGADQIAEDEAELQASDVRPVVPAGEGLCLEGPADAERARQDAAADALESSQLVPPRPEPSVRRCHLCRRVRSTSTRTPWVPMGYRKDLKEHIYVCGACRDYIVNQH